MIYVSWTSAEASGLVTGPCMHWPMDARGLQDWTLADAPISVTLPWLTLLAAVKTWSAWICVDVWRLQVIEPCRYYLLSQDLLTMLSSMNVYLVSINLTQAIAQNCGQLQSLNLGWCDNITDKGVTSLASGCPDLRAVDLCGCVLITGIWSDSL